MSINITGKNSLIEQLLAEELTKKGFKVQIISEASANDVKKMEPSEVLKLSTEAVGNLTYGGKTIKEFTKEVAKYSSNHPLEDPDAGDEESRTYYGAVGLWMVPDKENTHFIVFTQNEKEQLHDDFVYFNIKKISDWSQKSIEKDPMGNFDYKKFKNKSVDVSSFGTSAYNMEDRWPQ